MNLLLFYWDHSVIGKPVIPLVNYLTLGSTHCKVLQDNTDRQVATQAIGLSLQFLLLIFLLKNLLLNLTPFFFPDV